MTAMKRSATDELRPKDTRGRITCSLSTNTSSFYTREGETQRKITETQKSALSHGYLSRKQLEGERPTDYESDGKQERVKELLRA